jgi:hypothetical protein
MLFLDLLQNLVQVVTRWILQRGIFHVRLELFKPQQLADRQQVPVIAEACGDAGSPAIMKSVATTTDTLPVFFITISFPSFSGAHDRQRGVTLNSCPRKGWWGEMLFGEI